MEEDPSSTDAASTVVGFLPEEVLLKVLSEVSSVEDLVAASCTCRRYEMRE